MMKFGSTLIAGASAIALLASAGSASAAVTLTAGQFGGTGVHSVSGATGSTLTGLAGSDLVTLSSTDEVIESNGGGESDYSAVDHLMDDLTVAFSYYYDAVTFNLSPPNGATSTMHLSVNGGAFTFDVPGGLFANPLGNGQNKFILSATGGDSIHTLDFTFDAGVDHIQQIRVGNAVPEPTTWAMLIGGLGMVGAGLRRRRTLVAA
jgi:hypothetical protein